MEAGVSRMTLNMSVNVALGSKDCIAKTVSVAFHFVADHKIDQVIQLICFVCGYDSLG